MNTTNNKIIKAIGHPQRDRFKVESELARGTVMTTSFVSWDRMKSYLADAIGKGSTEEISAVIASDEGIVVVLK